MKLSCEVLSHTWGLEAWAVHSNSPPTGEPVAHGLGSRFRALGLNPQIFTAPQGVVRAGRGAGSAECCLRPALLPPRLPAGRGVAAAAAGGAAAAAGGGRCLGAHVCAARGAGAPPELRQGRVSALRR